MGLRALRALTGFTGPAYGTLTGNGLYGPTGLTGRLRDYGPYGPWGPLRESEPSSRITLTELPNGTNANDVILCLPSWDVQIGFPKNMLTFWTPRKCPKNEMEWGSVQMPHLYFVASWSFNMPELNLVCFRKTLVEEQPQDDPRNPQEIPQTKHPNFHHEKVSLFFLSKKNVPHQNDCPS